MKCIVYISKVRTRKSGAMIPEGLSEIFRSSRKKNAQNDITGVLSYRKGHYIQALEGDESIVDKLFSRIQQDERHEQVTLIFECTIAQRFFPAWGMKLLESTNRDTNFIKLLDQNSSTISQLESDKKRLLGLFYNLNGSSAEFSASYQEKDLMLSAWPDFTSITPSPVIIEICARLTKRPYSYESLVESKELGTQRQIDAILNKFNSMNILKVTDTSEQVQFLNAASQKKPNKFYSKMRNFLGLY